MKASILFPTVVPSATTSFPGCGLRITNYRKTTIIAFSVSEKQKQVTILGVFYGGQNYEHLLSRDD